MRVRFIKQHFGSLYRRILRRREDTPYFAPRCVLHRQIMTIDPLTDVPGLLGWKSLVWICHDCENTGHRAQRFHPPPLQSVPLWRGGTQLALIFRCDQKKWVFAWTPNPLQRRDAPAQSFPADPRSAMPVRHEGAGLPRPEDRSGLRRGLDAPPELINHFLIATLDRDARRDWSGNSLSRKPEGDNAPRVAEGSHPRYGVTRGEELGLEADRAGSDARAGTQLIKATPPGKDV